MRISTYELTTYLGGELVGQDLRIEGASIDSRTIRPGQLFVPIVAERDGHAFIPAALEAGAPAYLTAQEPVGGTAIRVRDTAAWWSTVSTRSPRRPRRPCARWPRCRANASWQSSG